MSQATMLEKNAAAATTITKNNNHHRHHNNHNNKEIMNLIYKACALKTKSQKSIVSQR